MAQQQQACLGRWSGATRRVAQRLFLPVRHFVLNPPNWALVFAVLVHQACLCSSLVLVVKALQPARATWFAAGIVLLVLQQCFTAYQLLVSHMGNSTSLGPCPLNCCGCWLGRAFQKQCSCWSMVWHVPRAWACAFLAVPLLDLAAVCALTAAPCAVANAEPGGDSKDTFPAWALLYARRRLGIAGWLQALPQAFFQLYVLLLCYAQHGECDGGRPCVALLATSLVLDVLLILVSICGMIEVFQKVSEWLTWHSWGALVREVVDCGAYIADIGSDIAFAVGVFHSGSCVLRVLPILFLTFQYPASVLVLLWFNWETPSEANKLKAVWAATVLSVTLWLVDVSAIFVLLASSADAAVVVKPCWQDDNMNTGCIPCMETAAWMLSLPLEYVRLLRPVALHGLLRCLRCVCFADDIPAVRTLLTPDRGSEEVWAENHMFARMPMEAMMESAPQILLQCVAFALLPQQRRLLFFMFSMALSSVSILKAFAYIPKAGGTLGLGKFDSVKMMLQLKGSFRVPAARLNHRNYQANHSASCLKFSMPTNLTPSQEAGLFVHHIMQYHKRRYKEGWEDKWVLQVEHLRLTELQIRRSRRQARMNILAVLSRGQMYVQHLKEIQLNDGNSFNLVKQLGLVLDGMTVTAFLYIPYIDNGVGHVTIEDCNDIELEHLKRPTYSLSSILEGWCESGLSRLHIQPSSDRPERLGHLTVGPQPLTVCNSLTTLLEGLWQLTTLKHLDVTQCSSLATLPDRLGQHATLQHLNLTGCSKLTTLPDKLGQLTTLQHLNLTGCSKLTTLPDRLGQLTALQELVLTRCSSLTKLPKGLWELTALQHLDLSGCGNPTKLPEGLGQLTTLHRLDLSRCRKLIKLPDGLGRLAALQKLVLTGCSGLTKLPKRLYQLTALQELVLTGCSSLTELPERLGQLTALQRLCLTDCWRLTKLPEGLGKLTMLQHLDMSRCFRPASPEWLGQLTKLQCLYLHGCDSTAALLQCVGRLTMLHELDLHECWSLTTLPNGLGQLTALHRLYLIECSSLTTLPEELGLLTKLQHLRLTRCSTLTTLPQWLGQLTALLRLNINGCDKLATLPQCLGQLTALLELDLHECRSLTTLPESLRQLTALHRLDLRRCEKLAALPDGLGQLTALQELVLNGCGKLTTLPEGLGQLTTLQKLYLTHCSSLTTLPDRLGQLTVLQGLHLGWCNSLTMLPDGLRQLTTLHLDTTGCDKLPQSSVVGVPGRHGEQHASGSRPF